MNLLSIFQQRHSIRKYTGAPIDDAALTQIIQAGLGIHRRQRQRHAPSSVRMPYRRRLDVGRRRCGHRRHRQCRSL